MGLEFETQILDINKDETIERLRKLGAEETPEAFQKRWIFDIECLNAKNPGLGKWVRLRQNNGRNMLTYKNRFGTGISETEEIEVEVGDFDKTAEIFSKLSGFIGKFYQENKRHLFKYDGIEFSIDSWPMIPTFLEIESNSEEKVRQGLKLLDLEGKDAGHIGILSIYKKYNIDLHSFPTLKFN